MQRLVCAGIWKEIGRIAQQSTTVEAAVAYTTSDRYIRFKRGDTLVVDASNQAIQGGETSALVLARAVERGADVYSLPGLHAKVMRFDQTAVIGSANLSACSATDSQIEVDLFTDDAPTVGAIHSFIRQLCTKAEKVDGRFIQRIRKIKVRRRTGRRRATNPPSRPPRLRPARTWLLGVWELREDAHADENARAEAGRKRAERLKHLKDSDVSWIRWCKSDRFGREGREGDWIIQIWNPLKSKRASAVFARSLILSRQVEAKCNRFYLEERADMDDTALSWGVFKRILRQSGFTHEAKRGCGRLLTHSQAAALDASWVSAK